MNDVVNEARVQCLDLAPGQARSLPAGDGAALVYVVDGALATDHPVAALKRVLRGEFVRFDDGAQPRIANASRRDALRVAVIFGLPAGAGGPPVARYFSDDDKAGRLCLAASRNGRDATLALGVAWRVYVTRLAARDTIVFEPASEDAVAFLLSGEAMANRTALEPMRLQRIKEDTTVRLGTDTAAHLLVIDFADDDT